MQILPFTVGKNLLEVILINRREIYGYSLFDVVYFIPLYFSDVILLLIYQNYLSKRKNITEIPVKISKDITLSSLMLLLFTFIVFLRSINHEFGHLIILSSLYYLKYVLIFLLPNLIDFNREQNKIVQVILGSTLFQSIIIIIEQIRRGNIGTFIENTLPGLEYGTFSFESLDLLRANGTFNEPNIAAIFLLINFCIILFSFIKILKLYRNKIHFTYLFSLIAIFSAIIFTGSRSIYFLTGLLSIYIFIINSKIIKKYYVLFKSSKYLKIFVIVIIISTLPYLYNRFNTINDVLSEKGSLSYRKELNSYSLKLYNNNLLGIGINMTPFYLVKYFKNIGSETVIFDQAPAHNIFIQILTEEGYAGFIIFLAFLYFAYRKLLLNPKALNEYSISSILFIMAAQFHPVFTTHPEIFSFLILYLSFSLLTKRSLQ